MSHGNRANLNTAVSSAVRREIPSGGFVWANVSENTHPVLMAATLARWALIKNGTEEPGPSIYVATDEEIDEWLNEDIDDWLNEEESD